MKAERQYKEATSRVLQQSKGGKSFIIDNRPQSENQTKKIDFIRNFAGSTLQCTIYDEELDPVAWTDDFDRKHFAYNVEEAVTKSLARFKSEAFKSGGARPSSNSVILYDKPLLWYLKDCIRKKNIRNNRMWFKAAAIIELGPMSIKLLGNSTVYVFVDENGKICHLNSIEPGTSTSYPLKSRSISLDD